MGQHQLKGASALDIEKCNGATVDGSLLRLITCRPDPGNGFLEGCEVLASSIDSNPVVTERVAVIKNDHYVIAI